MTEVVTIAPDERALREHLKSAKFQIGVDSGRWRVISIEWPHALIAVSAAPRPESPNEFVLNFELSGYPTAAPTATPWATDLDAILQEARRPKGVRAGRLFRADWEGGAALYAPYDRVGRQHWAEGQYRRYAWHARRDLTFYLTNVHDVLNDDEYLGVQG